jgi:transcriptional regulator with XRE-family HTH domain
MRDISCSTISPDVRAIRRRQICESLRDKTYRDEFVRQQIETGLPFQIKGMRRDRKWNQSQLGDLLGKPQSVVSRLENPGYGKFNLQTLREIASAFDVALLVAFVPFSALTNRVVGFSVADVEVPRFEDDPGFSAQMLIGDTSNVVDLFPSAPRKTNVPELLGVAVTEDFSSSAASTRRGNGSPLEWTAVASTGAM